MNLYSFVIVLLGVAACASNEAQRPAAATPKTEPAPLDDTQRAEPKSKTTPVPAAAPKVEPEKERPSDAHAPSSQRDATPEHQGEASSDLAITQRIRKVVVSDDSLSFTAKNVKIITRDGEVTLLGQVKNDGERRAIEQYAQQAVGKHRVHDQLDVAK